MPIVTSRRPRPPGSLVVLAALALAVAACSSSPAGDAATAGPGTIPAVNATAAPLLPDRADSLPSVTLAEYELLLMQLRGTPVVVNMWGSWCPPCKSEAPMLAAASARYGGRVQFLGIDIEDSVTSARRFIRQYGWTFPSIRDPVFPSALRSGLGFAAQPNTLFYDAAGHLVDSWQGQLPPAELRAGIRKILPAG
jgi:cytochrome c biogenesis protein CcmG/thiol:disulfide interchange protein DsbE